MSSPILLKNRNFSPLSIKPIRLTPKIKINNPNLLSNEINLKDFRKKSKKLSSISQK